MRGSTQYTEFLVLKDILHVVCTQYSEFLVLPAQNPKIVLTREDFTLATTQLLHHKEVTNKLLPRRFRSVDIQETRPSDRKQTKVPCQSERPGHVRSSFAMHPTKTIV